MEPLRKRIWRALDTGAAAIFAVAMVVALAYGAYVEFSPSKIRQRDPAAEAAATRAEDARRPKHPDVLLQVAVSKVSIDAGLAMISPYLSYAMDDPAPCLMAKHIDRGVALGGDPIVIKMAADFHAECQFVELTRALMCARRPNSDHPCRLNIDQGRKAAL